jgi:hypothetical protein
VGPGRNHTIDEPRCSTIEVRLPAKHQCRRLCATDRQHSRAVGRLELGLPVYVADRFGDPAHPERMIVSVN